MRLPLAVTLSAQAGVAPVLVATFEEVSLVAPIANLLAAPAVAPATVLGLVAAPVAAAWPPAGAVVASFARPFVWWIAEVAEACAAVPAAAVGVPDWAAWPLAGAAAGAAILTLTRATLRP